MHSFLWKIYLSRFFDSFILIGVIFALLFNQNGLTPLQISTLLSIWSITTILTEVPFGVLADTYPRRNLLIIGLLIRAVGFGFWMMGGYLNYAIGFVMWGLKNTLSSGTLEGLVYDELAYYKHEDTYEEVNGKMSSFFSAGLFFSAIFGGLVAQINFQYVLLASIVTTVISALILTTIKSVKSVRSTNETNYYSTLVNALKEIKGNKLLIYIIVFNCIVFGAFGASDEFWSLIFEHLKLNATIIGFLIAAVYGLGSIAGYTIKYFQRLSLNSGYLLIIVGAICYLVLGITKSMLFLPLAFLGIYLFQVTSIKVSSLLQKHISSNQRSTVSSIQSLAFELAYMGFILILGYYGTKFGVMSVLVTTGVIIAVSTLLLTAFQPKSDKL